MSVDDPVVIAQAQLGEVIDASFERQFTDVTVPALLSLIPVAGAGMAALLAGKATHEVHLRIARLFQEMSTRMGEIAASVPDPSYYESGEFQTLLGLAIEQLKTTHDEEKRRRLAQGLANSGSSEFARVEDKEQHFRTLSDLSPRDLKSLADLGSAAPADAPGLDIKFDNPVAELRCSLMRLVGLGLVVETLVAPRTRGQPLTDADAMRAFLDRALRPPDSEFRISEYGREFLRFLGGSTEVAA